MYSHTLGPWDAGAWNCCKYGNCFFVGFELHRSFLLLWGNAPTVAWSFQKNQVAIPIAGASQIRKRRSLQLWGFATGAALRS